MTKLERVITHLHFLMKSSYLIGFWIVDEKVLERLCQKNGSVSITSFKILLEKYIEECIEWYIGGSSYRTDTNDYRIVRRDKR